MILICLLKLFHVKYSGFQNIKRLLSYTQKCTKKRRKLGLRRNVIRSNKKKYFKFKM